MKSAEALIQRVLELEKDSISLNECELATAAPTLAKMLQVALETLKEEYSWCYNCDSESRACTSFHRGAKEALAEIERIAGERPNANQ